MPQVGFKPTIPVFELAKIFYALDCAATVIGMYANVPQKTWCYVGIDLYIIYLSISLSIYPSIFIPVAPTWSIEHS
jgi:hypothetical protein